MFPVERSSSNVMRTRLSISLLCWGLRASLALKSYSLSRMPKSRRGAIGSGHSIATAQTRGLRIVRPRHSPSVQASLGAVQAEYRCLQLALVNSRHQHVQRTQISSFQFQAVHRGLLNGRNAEREQRRRSGRTKERWGEPSATSERLLTF